MAAVALDYPSADDLERTGSGSGPVRLKPSLPPPRYRLLIKIDHSVTFEGGPAEYGQFQIVKSNIVGDGLAGFNATTSVAISQGILQDTESAAIQAYPFNAKTADKLKGIYKLDANHATHRMALDLIVDYLDDWLNEGAFPKCNAMLVLAEPERLSDSAIVTFLGITKAARDNPMMFGRDVFYRRARGVVAARRGSEEAADKLLNRYL